jgi:hypothetical protein
MAYQYAMITPSFRLDLDRCELLAESVERWVAPHVKHYIVVDRRDVPLFKPLVNARTELVIVEDIVPNWVVRIPGVRRFWFSFRSRPLKNWILQQLVKLSMPAHVSEDVLLYTDSDVFFCKSYDPREFERDGKVPLQREPGQLGLIPHNVAWIDAASRLLGIPFDPADADIDYVGNAICWRKDHALALRDRVSQVAGKQWELAIAPLSKFSEYILYGVHESRVLGGSSGHWHDPVIRTLTHWKSEPLDIAALQSLKARQQPLQHSVMISAKSRTAVADIRHVFAENFRR